jgi:hypothetical protein
MVLFWHEIIFKLLVLSFNAHFLGNKIIHMIIDTHIRRDDESIRFTVKQRTYWARQRYTRELPPHAYTYLESHHTKRIITCTYATHFHGIIYAFVNSYKW